MRITLQVLIELTRIEIRIFNSISFLPGMVLIELTRIEIIVLLQRPGCA